MRIHRALVAFQVLSALLLAGAAHAQQPASAAAPASAVAATDTDTDVDVDAEPSPHAAPLRGRRAVAALAVALEPVTLAPNANIDPDLLGACNFEEFVGVDVAKMLRHYRLGGGKPTGNDARVLRIAVTDISGSTGGVYTGTKSIRIHATLLVDGKVDRETDIYRYNTGGNPFRGTCHIFRQHTKRLGKDLAAWIKDARYKVDDRAMGDKDDAD
jgi:hypothetical protein